MKTNDQIANWAMDLQSLAQAGLRYGHDVFDRERYEEIRRIAGEMMAARTGIPEKKLKTLFLGDEWSLPGGWNDYDQTVADNCVKEAFEESGRKVEPVKIIAVQDRNHHNKPILATNVTKIFFLCKELGGTFIPNDETDACDYFALDNLPNLSIDRNTEEQIAMCFEANNDPNLDTKFE